MEWNIYLTSGLSLIGGLVISYLLVNLILKQKRRQIISEAKTEGERIKKHKFIQAKEKFIELKIKHEKTINHREHKLLEQEKKVKQREVNLNQSIEQNKKQERDFRKKIENLDRKTQSVDQLQNDLEEKLAQKISALETLSGLSVEEAKKELISSLKEEAKSEASAYIQETIGEAKLNAKNEAQKIVIQTIQRIGVETAIENTVTVFNIENDDMKGRIIGREGRNIRAFEAATGVEVIVDDTPESIVLSCFNPVRREIARLSLHKLIQDGRIHPARIEEVVGKTTRQIEDEIIKTGKRTVIDLGIHGVHTELIKTIGRMKYRSSYGQNLLQHSREVANIAATMASELGLNPKIAKRAGLLHDIGKVPEEESETPHALLGMEWAEKYGEKPEVCNAIGAHHDEIEMTSLISPIVQVADAISGARPGARRQAMESYIKRLKDLENIAMSKKGVTSAYAIQAGRELRVVVENETISDKDISTLAFDISQEIQNNLTYPGQIRVTVIRESRAVSVAK